MTLKAYKGKCFHCGHDHGDGSLPSVTANRQDGTPRTDALRHGRTSTYPHRARELAERLERELAAAQAKIDTAQVLLYQARDRGELRGVIPAALSCPRSTGVSEVWAILYEDRDRQPEIFVEAGAEEAARGRYKQALNSWNCYLLCTSFVPAEQAKVSEAVPCRHEWYQGTCAHCCLDAGIWQRQRIAALNESKADILKTCRFWDQWTADDCKRVAEEVKRLHAILAGEGA